VEIGVRGLLDAGFEEKALRDPNAIGDVMGYPIERAPRNPRGETATIERDGTGSLDASKQIEVLDPPAPVPSESLQEPVLCFRKRRGVDCLSVEQPVSSHPVTSQT
jgi:hypothetical protein